jgi:hypothetical protein
MAIDNRNIKRVFRRCRGRTAGLDFSGLVDAPAGFVEITGKHGHTIQDTASGFAIDVGPIKADTIEPETAHGAIALGDDGGITMYGDIIVTDGGSPANTMVGIDQTTGYVQARDALVAGGDVLAGVAGPYPATLGMAKITGTSGTIEANGDLSVGPGVIGLAPADPIFKVDSTVLEVDVRVPMHFSDPAAPTVALASVIPTTGAAWFGGDVTIGPVSATPNATVTASTGDISTLGKIESYGDFQVLTAPATPTFKVEPATGNVYSEGDILVGPAIGALCQVSATTGHVATEGGVWVGPIGGTAVATIDGTTGAAAFEGDVEIGQIGTPTVTITASTGDISCNSLTGGLTGDITGDVTGNISGNVGGSVGSVTGDVGGDVTGDVVGSVASVSGNVTGTVGGLTARTAIEVTGIPVYDAASDWTCAGYSSLGSSKTAEIMYYGFQTATGEVISKFRVQGTATIAGASTLDADLVKVTGAGSVSTLGSITQVTENGEFDQTITLGAAETCGANTFYAIKLTGTTAAGDSLIVGSTSVAIKRKA